MWASSQKSQPERTGGTMEPLDRGTTAGSTSFGLRLPGPEGIPGTGWAAAAAGTRWCWTLCTRAQPSCLGSPGTTTLVPLGPKINFNIKFEGNVKNPTSSQASLIWQPEDSDSLLLNFFSFSQVWLRKSLPLPVCAFKIKYDRQHKRADYQGRDLI